MGFQYEPSTGYCLCYLVSDCNRRDKRSGANTYRVVYGATTVSEALSDFVGKSGWSVKAIVLPNRTLSGTLPPSTFWNKLTNLQTLNLANNMITGTIPSGLAQNKITALALYG